MNLSVVYELRDRLEASAIAGVNLIQEDFRLQRAVEQMAPFAAASPVFKKITAMSRQVLEPDCPDRAGFLLDLMALIDAVLRTQGTIKTDGELMELQGNKNVSGNSGRIVVNVPYSQMAPLVEAFRGTGGGRYVVIRDAHEKNPELFSDYRIQNLMVEALGDSYSDLAEMVAEWLKNADADIIPLLKRGFNKDGKREMVRRIQVMEAIAGAGENDFYRSVLEDSNKEVKEAAIRALRYESANTELLLGLIKSERGKLKVAAKETLAYMNTEEAADYWQREMKKSPLKAAQYLQNSYEDWASDLMADVLNQFMDHLEQEERNDFSLKEEERETFVTLWWAAEGKHSQKLCNCYSRVVHWIPELTGEILLYSLLRTPHPALAKVAEQLYADYGDRYLDCVFLSALLFSSPEEVYDRFHAYLEPEGIPDRLTGKKRSPMGIVQIFSRFFYQKETGKFMISLYSCTDTVSCAEEHGVEEREIDMRWYPLLLSCRERFFVKFTKDQYNRNGYSNIYDAMVAQLYQPGKGLEESYSKFFYDGIRKQGLTVGDIRMLKQCGWKDFHDLLIYGPKGGIDRWELMEILQEMPFDGPELAKELEPLIQEKSNSKSDRFILERLYQSLKQGASAADWF